MISSEFKEKSNMDISPAMEGLTRRVSSNLSTSPVAKTYSPLSRSATYPVRSNTNTLAKALKPFATEDIKILLLENINQTGRDTLIAQGYQVECLKSSLPEDELIQKIRWGNLASALPIFE